MLIVLMDEIEYIADVILQCIQFQRETEPYGLRHCRLTEVERRDATIISFQGGSHNRGQGEEEEGYPQLIV